MKVRQVKIEDTTVIHVYISKEESEKEEIQEEVTDIKKKNKNVVVFSGGSINTDMALQNMIKNKMEEV